MDISDSLLALFSAQVEEQNGSYVVEIPEQELELGQVDEGDVYRVGLIEALEPDQDSTGSTRASTSSSTRGEHRQTSSPPVEKGDIKEVEIEDMGEKGDGVARIGPGYIVFVEGTTVGDRVKIRITEARENFAFGEVLKHVQKSGKPV